MDARGGRNLTNKKVGPEFGREIWRSRCGLHLEV
jgi:hypothetical protein